MSQNGDKRTVRSDTIFGHLIHEIHGNEIKTYFGITLMFDFQFSPSGISKLNLLLKKLKRLLNPQPTDQQPGIINITRKGLL